ncbi:MAG: bifunctional 4'-phosphopantothenoylcysteine decarboxylase/phosphopantothenoylcysteine synthetase, partial [Candidatus Omnitrophica bacterium]|nr:bifunctional 4'-phosphopantothenoylcysteine decarboxylase/phosphopantothenoylcysteine synthetase [Candidatus Omnitrophota bacterium]
MSQPKRIILGVTGSIAAYRSADIVRGFLEKGLRVSVVMTRAAEQFITPLTMSSLSGERCYTSMF